jgi:hypothetical protein
MAALPNITNSVAASSALLETFRLATTSLPETTPQSRGTTISSSMAATVSKNSPRKQYLSNNRHESTIQNFFSSYADILLQQQRAQTMLAQDLSVSGNTSTGKTTVLNRYQTLQYRQNSSDRIFNLKSDIFQSMYNIIA